MRLLLRLVDREAAGGGGGLPVLTGAPAGRFLASASVDHFDRRDGEWWPFVRLPSLFLDAGAVEALVEGSRDLLAGAAPGFSWRAGDAAPLALQLAADPGAGPVVVEVGLELGGWLGDVSGAEPGGEACLFRFAADRAALVRFADALGAEAREIAGR
jgi:hypothetical protein